MPKTIETFGSQGEDREIDDIERRLAALERGKVQVNTQPRPPQITPVEGIFLQDVSGNPNLQVQVIEFDSADGVTISDDGGNGLVTITVVKTFAKTGGTLRTGDISLTEGSGISITDNGDGTFTIASSSGSSQTVQTKSADYVALVTDWWILASGTHTITLPIAITHAIGVRNFGAGTITVAADGGGTVDGGTVSLAPGTAAIFMTDATNFYSFGNV